MPLINRPDTRRTPGNIWVPPRQPPKASAWPQKTWLLTVAAGFRSLVTGVELVLAGSSGRRRQ